MQPGVKQSEIDEARPSDLDRFNMGWQVCVETISNLAGKGTRVTAPGGFPIGHSNVGGPVTVFAAGWPLELYRAGIYLNTNGGKCARERFGQLVTNHAGQRIRRSERTAGTFWESAFRFVPGRKAD